MKLTCLKFLQKKFEELKFFHDLLKICINQDIEKKGFFLKFVVENLNHLNVLMLVLSRLYIMIDIKI